MIKIPITEETKYIASCLIWFKPPEDALNDPYTFLAYVMRNGTLPEVTTIRNILGLSAFEEALDHMPPGIIDKRSWVYWHTLCDRTPIPPLPQRFLQ